MTHFQRVQYLERTMTLKMSHDLHAEIEYFRLRLSAVKGRNFTWSAAARELWREGLATYPHPSSPEEPLIAPGEFKTQALEEHEEHLSSASDRWRPGD